MASSISTKFRKIVQENRVGVLQDRLFWLTTFHDENAWWTFLQDKTLWGWQSLVLIRIETRDLKITPHKYSLFLSRHGGAIFNPKDIWINHKSQIPYMSFRRSPFNLRLSVQGFVRWTLRRPWGVESGSDPDVRREREIKPGTSAVQINSQ